MWDTSNQTNCGNKLSLKLWLQFSFTLKKTPSSTHFWHPLYANFSSFLHFNLYPNTIYSISISSFLFWLYGAILSAPVSSPNSTPHPWPPLRSMLFLFFFFFSWLWIIGQCDLFERPFRKP